MTDENYLSLECRRLGESLFGTKVTDAVVKRYVEAHRKLFPEATDRICQRVVREGWDVEAVELALRLKDRKNLLSRKSLMLSYLLETEVPHGRAYLNLRPARLRAFLTLIGLTFYSVWKLFKGRILIRRLEAHAGT